jgi:lysozyme family protein
VSEFLPAITATLIEEGGFYHNTKTGEIANWGITSWTLIGQGLMKAEWDEDIKITYMRAITRDQAVAWYERSVWMPSHIALLDDQRLANKVFDLCVNTGTQTGIELLQIAYNSVAVVPLIVDGVIGTMTAGAVNRWYWTAQSARNAIPKNNDPDLLRALRRVAEAHYRTIAARNPLEADNLDGWLKRLAKG